MNQIQQQTAETEAVITVSDQAPGTPKSQAVFPPGSTPPTLVNTVLFSYSSDVMQLGDAFTVTVPNPRGQYTGKFIVGQCVQLFLKNPNVNGNQLTLKHLGIIVDKQVSCSSRGSVIQLTCCDLGWHLANNDAPLFTPLNGVKWQELLTSPKWIHPSWGIRGLSTDNDFQRRVRQGGVLPQGRAQYALDLQALGTLVYIQVEPGDKISEIITSYCRRVNRLVNVTCDGYLQIWLPDYQREPLYRLELHDYNDPNRNRNGILESHITENISTLYTQVTCVGENVGGEFAADPGQNSQKRIGNFVNNGLLPFLHRVNFADGEIFAKNTAEKQAAWFYRRGIFDSWQAVYVVRGHWQQQQGQRAYWWESDQLCAIEDRVNGLSGTFYIAAVRCDRDENGDRTFITLRKPVLSASFGEFPPPESIKDNIVEKRKPTVTNNGLTQKIQ